MNRLKTTILLATLTGLFLLAGRTIGGNQGLTIALLFSVVFNIGTYWFSDTVILRMYKAVAVTPASQPKLYTLVRELATSAQLPMPKVYIIPMPSPNAFATGRNPKHSAVAVSPAIMELLNEQELRGVLAHELAHIKNRDILTSTIAATIAGALSYIAQMGYYASMFGGFGGNDDNNNGGVVSSLLMVLIAPVIATILQLSISRAREYAADATGAKICHDPKGLASALRKLDTLSAQHKLIGKPAQEAMAHMFIINPFKGSAIMSLFSTHPPMSERIARLEAMRTM